MFLSGLLSFITFNHIKRVKACFTIFFTVFSFSFILQAKENKLPIWLIEPVTETRLGFIGSSNAFSITKNGSLLRSRTRAVESYIDYMGITLPVLTDEQLLSNAIFIANQQLTFASEIIYDSVLYSYLYQSKFNNAHKNQLPLEAQKKVADISCHFSQCQPSWLCKQGNSIVGVSQITGNPGKQLLKARENAEYVAKFLNYAEVSFDSEVSSYSSELVNSRVEKTQSNIITKEADFKLLHTASCYSDNYVFSNFQLPARLQYSHKKNWLQEPNHDDLTGVVGSFNGFLPDGRIKTAINLAIKKGLLALAKTKSIQIANSATFNEKNGHIIIEHTTESGNATVKATLNAIEIKENSYGFTIHVWLLELK